MYQHNIKDGEEYKDTKRGNIRRICILYSKDGPYKVMGTGEILNFEDR